MRDGSGLQSAMPASASSRAHQPVGVDVLEAAEHLLLPAVAFGLEVPRNRLQARGRLGKLRGRGLEHAERDVESPERARAPA